MLIQKFFFVVLKDLKATPRIIFVCNLNVAFEIAQERTGLVFKEVQNDQFSFQIWIAQIMKFFLQ